MGKFKHGRTGQRVHDIWLGMIDRCRNDRQGTYGNRGIRVCQRWESSFENFYSDMGDPPSIRHSIDRIDVNGDYEPNNCRWATRKEQARNTTRNTILTSRSLSMTIAEWSEHLGIKPATICRRLANNWSVDDALHTPVRPWRVGKPWAPMGISRSTYYRRRTQ